MSLLFSKMTPSGRYEVRAAGRTRRLYRGGVFHSQLNLRTLLTGGVWDLLWVPALFSPFGQVRRVAVLGVGGGAVIRQLDHFLRPEEIVGVEIDPLQIAIARRFFGLRGRRIRIVQKDARDWVREYQGAPFDLIIDDLYQDRGGEPLRAVAACSGWMCQLLRLLTPRGTLVMNFVDLADLRRCAYFSSASLARRFRAAYRLRHPANENAVVAFLRQPADPRALRSRLAQLPGLSTSRTRGLRYSIRRLPAP